MKTEHFNQLSEAESERLAILMEECAEVIQIVGKILRHGYESYPPSGGNSNQLLLSEEIGHVEAAIERLKTTDLNAKAIDVYREAKATTAWRYLHHQP